MSEPIKDEELGSAARRAFDLALNRGLRVAIAESCTGGLIAATLTEIPGAGDVLDRGFVTYSNDAKHEMLGVPSALIEHEGAVSAAVATAMAQGALKHSHADIAVAVTGIAGPSGGTEAKPLGLVFIAATTKNGAADLQEFNFGARGRNEVRAASAIEAFRMLNRLMDVPQNA